MVDPVLLYIQFRCGELFEIVSNEEDPEQMLLLLSDLTEMLENLKAPFKRHRAARSRRWSPAA